MILQKGEVVRRKKNTLNTKLLNWANRLIEAVFAKPSESGEVSHEVTRFLELFERNVKKNKVLLYSSWYTI
jgi:TorA maturation chaperone TorD